MNTNAEMVKRMTNEVLAGKHRLPWDYSRFSFTLYRGDFMAQMMGENKSVHFRGHVPNGPPPWVAASVQAQIKAFL